MSGSSTAPICPCGGFIHPAVVYNGPGLTKISYSPGDYLAFRHALLQALSDENELSRRSGGQLIPTWRPAPEGDLAVQMIEWWAYLCDILGFYNERIATQAYLRTADLPESVNRLIQLLGYRPRPALGSHGTLAALLTGRGPITLPQGMQIQSKPGPGKQPQFFELDADTVAGTPDDVTARPVPQRQSLFSAAAQGQANQPGQLLLAGKVSGIKPGDKLLLIGSSVLQGTASSSFLWLSVTGTSPATDPYGQPVTQVSYAPLQNSLTQNVNPADYVLLRNAQSTGAWTYPGVTTPVVTTTTIDLATLARGLDAGQLMLIEVTGTTSTPFATAPVIAQSNAESVWYANGFGPFPPIESPPGSVPAVTIPHATITFGPALPAGLSNQDAPKITARWSWTSVGTLTANLSAGDVVLTGGSGTLAAQAGSFPAGSAPVLLQDANGNGASAQADAGTGGGLSLSQVSTLPADGLVPPLDVLFNLLAVSRGKTVTNEILGNGNGTIAGQDFMLSQSPVTYQQDPQSKSGDNYSSTVRVWVNQLEWLEQRSFYGQDTNAQIFVLREDESGNTHVVFGDGVNGARLPTGTNNVVASYRAGAGAEAPAPGTLITALNPPPGLKSLVNPLAPTGGADADPANRIRTLAPSSVFTFGRAVSLDDYESIAAGAPGVAQAKAAFVFDPLAQRPTVTLWVAGDEGAVAAVYAALAGATDPNRPVRVLAASEVQATLTLTYVRDPRRDDGMVRAALTAALTDPDSGLFGVNNVGIGQAFYDSEIYQACLAVPGVEAVHSLNFAPVSVFLQFNVDVRRLVSFGSRTGSGGAACTGQRHDPGSGGFFSVQTLRLLPGAAS
jgi:predicted phage baseplate assembly protein